ncbi:hypothetical protein HWV62_37763 [Athelia sp. TMB]|nr:hypothetical protein HWV62_37763 [Athelia sp. TMB]
MASSVAAAEVYARQLLPQKCGYPLFVPEPSTNSPPKFIERGVDFGDVGIVMDGKFFFVFSVTASSDDPINHLGVPDAFRPFRLNERFFDRYPNMHKKGSELTSSSIKRHHTSVEGGVKENEYDYFPHPCSILRLNTGIRLLHIPAGVDAAYTLKSSFSEAAVLNMPDGASSVDYRGLKELRSYAIRNGESWYEFINGTLGLEAPNGSLYLVTGCDKSTTWGIAAVSHGSSSNTIALRFTTAQVVQAAASYSYSWETHCPAFVRTGPDLRKDEPLPQNQCLFVRGLKIRVRENAVARQVKGAIRVDSTQNMQPSSVSSTRKSGSSQSGSSGQQDLENVSHSSDEEWSSDDEELVHKEVYHPLNIVEKYILDTTQARVAVTHECDWWPLSQDDALPSDDEILKRLHLYYEISHEGTGAFLNPRAISTAMGPDTGLGRDSFDLSPPHSFDFHPPSVWSDVLFQPVSHIGKILDKPEHPSLDASSPVPAHSGVYVPQTLPVSHLYTGHYNSLQDISFPPSNSPPSNSAALHTIPGSVSSPPLRFTASKSYSTPSSWPATWADPRATHSYSRHPVAKSPPVYDVYPVKRRNTEPLWQDTLWQDAMESSNQSRLSARAPLPVQSCAQMYSCRTDLTSQMDDNDNTIRMKKHFSSPDVFTSTETLSNTALPNKTLLRPLKPSPSAWQLYFTDWISRRQATNTTRKLNIAQAAKEAGQEYALLKDAERKPYKQRSQILKEAHEHEFDSYMRTSTPNYSKHLFRTAQDTTGRVRNKDIKDLKQPKKPHSAYFLFLQNIRANPRLMQEVYGSETDVTKQSMLASAKWRSMTDDERKLFLTQYEREKLDYEIMHRLYEESIIGHISSTDFSILSDSPDALLPIQSEAVFSSGKNEGVSMSMDEGLSTLRDEGFNMMMEDGFDDGFMFGVTQPVLRAR